MCRFLHDIFVAVRSLIFILIISIVLLLLLPLLMSILPFFIVLLLLLLVITRLVFAAGHRRCTILLPIALFGMLLASIRIFIQFGLCLFCGPLLFILFLQGKLHAKLVRLLWLRRRLRGHRRNRTCHIAGSFHVSSWVIVASSRRGQTGLIRAALVRWNCCFFLLQRTWCLYLHPSFCLPGICLHTRPAATGSSRFPLRLLPGRSGGSLALLLLFELLEQAFRLELTQELLRLPKQICARRCLLLRSACLHWIISSSDA
mmetsp:Transcript_73606/g.157852  ORF Transcript_73606/g.157852 Transcript_73606/m.157852 type:complete len:259 (+) Transcript_73606:1500-2276(+)